MNFLSSLSTTIIATIIGVMAGIIVVLSLSNFIFYQLYSGARDELVTFKAQVELVNAQVAADNERKLRLSDQVTADTRLELDAALDRLRHRPAVRVRECSGNSGTTATLSATPGVTLATPAADAADSARLITAEECEARLSDGIEDATRLAWLQHYVLKQHEVSQ